MAELRPQHRSMLGKSRLPAKFSRMEMTTEQREFLDNFALGIFADCVNNGLTFQATVSALYLSGLENGMAIATDTTGAKG